ncbi:Zinc finger BED domain-containing protein 5 [Anabarilius grahami]|uniref:Zinc finger BED domain-containing protein 5 n=1 Tax=Anabarilius grahami TaxID=495550 RepID=A0A3N0XT63_ANAGA|nr:Zinc finger BED domain-containing protein 5 [Anabarilius grahami]
MERDPTPVLKSIPLSNDTVARRINEMGADTEEQLCAILRDSPFSLQLDETTTADNNALLMAYVDGALGEKVSSSRCNIMYLADFFEKMNEVTLKLQGNDITLVKSKAIIHSLTSRLDLYRQSIGRRQFAHFPQLAKVSESLTDDLLLVYTDHLTMVKADMEIRFRDLLNLDVPSWVVQPFQADVIECEPAIQEHLVDIQCDDEAQAIFRTSGWCSMWVKYAQRYPALWQKIRLLILAFPTTYLVEQGFSQVIHMRGRRRGSGGR